MKNNKHKIILLFVILGAFVLFNVSNKFLRRRTNHTIIQLLWLTFSDKYYEPPYDVISGFKTNKSRYEKIDAMIKNIYNEIVMVKDAHPSLENFGERNILKGRGARANYYWRMQFDSLPKDIHRPVYGGTKIDLSFLSQYCDSTCSYTSLYGPHGFDWEIFMPEIDKFLHIRISSIDSLLVEQLKSIIDRNAKGFKRVNDEN